MHVSSVSSIIQRPSLTSGQRLSLSLSLSRARSRTDTSLIAIINHESNIPAGDRTDCGLEIQSPDQYSSVRNVRTCTTRGVRRRRRLCYRRGAHPDKQSSQPLSSAYCPTGINI